MAAAKDSRASARENTAPAPRAARRRPPEIAPARAVRHLPPPSGCWPARAPPARARPSPPRRAQGERSGDEVAQPRRQICHPPRLSGGTAPARARPLHPAWAARSRWWLWRWDAEARPAPASRDRDWLRRRGRQTRGSSHTRRVEKESDGISPARPYAAPPSLRSPARLSSHRAGQCRLHRSRAPSGAGDSRCRDSPRRWKFQRAECRHW